MKAADIKPGQTVTLADGSQHRVVAVEKGFATFADGGRGVILELDNGEWAQVSSRAEIDE